MKTTKQPLCLGEYNGRTDEDLREQICSDYNIEPTILKPYQILAAGRWYGDYCGSGWILLKNKKTKELFESHGSHCSCNGLEGQFEPAHSSVAYLQSEQFSIDYISCDNDYPGEFKTLKEFLSTL